MRLVTYFVKKRAKKLGINSYAGTNVVLNFLYDYKISPISHWKKVHAIHKKGFSETFYDFFKIDDCREKVYLSDLQYSRMFPINGKYSCWIDDKLTFHMIMKKYKEYIPRLYYYIDYSGHILAMDAPTEDSENDVYKVVKLIEKEKVVVAKPIESSCLLGLHILEYKDNKFFDNKVCVSKEELVTTISGARRYLFQEYIKAADYMMDNTIFMRIIAFKEYGEKTIIDEAFLSKVEYIEHDYKYGVPDKCYYDLTRINIESGKTEGSCYLRSTSVTKSETGPKECTLKIDKVENWDMIKKQVCEICDYLVPIMYFGIDLIITNTGFKILEINSHQNLGFLQLFKPALKEGTKSRDFFMRRLGDV